MSSVGACRIVSDRGAAVTRSSTRKDGLTREREFRADFVEEPPVVAQRLGFWSALSEAESCLCASCGEDRGRERDELRQFPQILGCGG
jgi:hypothetical protein